MQLTVFGASGRTGVPMVEQALARGHEVTAFVRDASTFSVSGEGLTVLEGDAYTCEGVADAVEGSDAVLSVLGQSKSGPDDLLTVAGGHIMDAMETHDVERFVTLVGAGVRVEGDESSVFGTVMGTMLKLLAKEVLEDAEAHVEDVRSRHLAWTVVRVPRLSEAEARGEYEVGDVTPGPKAVARADVAEFMLDVAEGSEYLHQYPKIAY